MNIIILFNHIRISFLPSLNRQIFPLLGNYNLDWNNSLPFQNYRWFPSKLKFNANVTSFVHSYYGKQGVLMQFLLNFDV